jgi:hypothetical protein
MLAGLRPDARFRALMTRIEGDVLQMRLDSSELHDLFEKTVPGLPPIEAPPSR